MIATHFPEFKVHQILSDAPGDRSPGVLVVIG
jgi:hypothetical protein